MGAAVSTSPTVAARGPRLKRTRSDADLGSADGSAAHKTHVEAGLPSRSRLASRSEAEAESQSEPRSRASSSGSHSAKRQRLLRAETPSHMESGGVASSASAETTPVIEHSPVAEHSPPGSVKNGASSVDLETVKVHLAVPSSSEVKQTEASAATCGSELASKFEAAQDSDAQEDHGAGEAASSSLPRRDRDRGRGVSPSGSAIPGSDAESEESEGLLMLDVAERPDDVGGDELSQEGESEDEEPPEGCDNFVAASGPGCAVSAGATTPAAAARSTSDDPSVGVPPDCVGDQDCPASELSAGYSATAQEPKGASGFVSENGAGDDDNAMVVASTSSSTSTTQQSAGRDDGRGCSVVDGHRDSDDATSRGQLSQCKTGAGSGAREPQLWRDTEAAKVYTVAPVATVTRSARSLSCVAGECEPFVEPRNPQQQNSETSAMFDVERRLVPLSLRGKFGVEMDAEGNLLPPTKGLSGPGRSGKAGAGAGKGGKGSKGSAGGKGATKGSSGGKSGATRGADIMAQNGGPMRSRASSGLEKMEAIGAQSTQSLAVSAQTRSSSVGPVSRGPSVGPVSRGRSPVNPVSGTAHRGTAQQAVKGGSKGKDGTAGKKGKKGKGKGISAGGKNSQVAVVDPAVESTSKGVSKMQAGPVEQHRRVARSGSGIQGLVSSDVANASRSSVGGPERAPSASVTASARGAWSAFGGVLPGDGGRESAFGGKGSQEGILPAVRHSAKRGASVVSSVQPKRNAGVRKNISGSVRSKPASRAGAPPAREKKTRSKKPRVADSLVGGGGDMEESLDDVSALGDDLAYQEGSFEYDDESEHYNYGGYGGG